jgi:hypothetical protein
VKLDDEFDEVGVSLLPEWFFAFCKEIVEQCGDVVGQRIGIQIVVERVVTIVGIQVDFDIICFSSMAYEDVSYLMAEVAFDFKLEHAYAFLWIIGMVGDELLGIGIHAPAGLAGTDGPKDGDASE